MTRNYLAILSLVLVSIGAGCGYSEEEMQVKKDRIDQLTRSLDALQQKDDELQNRFTRVSADNASMQSRLKQMGMSAQDAQRSMEEMKRMIDEMHAKEKQAQARLQTFQNMIERFKKMIESGKLRVRIERGRMVVELAENILFDSGKAELKPEGKTALQEVGGVLQTIADRDFQIAGHTDNVPIHSAKFPSNWHLSTGRAVVVAQFLSENGVNVSRLSAAGYAETQPVSDNATPEGRAQNRRIEIVLMPNLDELPDLSKLQEGSK